VDKARRPVSQDSHTTQPEPPIRQVAALPYRTDFTGSEPRHEVMLITSRETRRWVLPKGNRIRGLADHQAAAHEAYEEAGLGGVACPAPLGVYRYRKRRKSGASLNFEVQVFPLAVTHQLEVWPEHEERETRWFSLAEAAAAVDEPDLGDLIRAFRPETTTTQAGLRTVLSRTDGLQRGNAMFSWFQALLPRQGNFFDLFEAHARTITAGADALARMVQGGPGMADHVREIFEREQEADELTAEVLRTVRRTFITPFDRSAITALIGAMDDVIDEMNATAKVVGIYDIKEFDTYTRDMTGLVIEAARVMDEAVGLLRKVSANAARLHGLTARLVALEGQADSIHDAGLKALFIASHDQESLRQFVVGRELFRCLEKIVDRFEDVANEIQGLVIDHA
jgi:uncharacterized protein